MMHKITGDIRSNLIEKIIRPQIIPVIHDAFMRLIEESLCLRSACGSAPEKAVRKRQPTAHRSSP